MVRVGYALLLIARADEEKHTRYYLLVSRKVLAAHERTHHLERRLDGRSYLCGEFTVADIGYFLTITFPSNLGAAPAETHPTLRAWYERVLARPSVAKEVAGMVAAMQQLAA